MGIVIYMIITVKQETLYTVTPLFISPKTPLGGGGGGGWLRDGEIIQLSKDDGISFP